MRTLALIVAAATTLLAASSPTTRTEALPIGAGGLSAAIDDISLTDQVHCRWGWRHHLSRWGRWWDGCYRYHRGAYFYPFVGRRHFIHRGIGHRRAFIGGGRIGGIHHGGARSFSGGGRGHGGHGGRGGHGRRSDIALKHDIVLLGHLNNGLGFYRFSYNGSDRAYVGVIAQEVQSVMPAAVTRGRDGYLRVYYSQLGLQFQSYEQWVASGAKIPKIESDLSD